MLRGGEDCCIVVFSIAFVVNWFSWEFVIVYILFSFSVISFNA